MTRPNLAVPKDPFPANDNFQELNRCAAASQQHELRPFQRDISPSSNIPATKQRGQRSSMVLGTAGILHLVEGVQSPLCLPKHDRFANWTLKSKIGRRKVTRSLLLREVIDLKSAWHHAEKIGLPLNRFITFRPADINEQSPEQRIQTWVGWRNKLAQFARDTDFAFTCLWTRESQRSTGLNEHLHVLMHVPKHLRGRFDKVVRGWRSATDEIDVRPSSYRTRRNRKGGESNVLTYVSKNSPQAGRFLDRIIQLGGPIFGRRFGLSRNLTANARARDEVRGGLRRDLRLPPASGFVVARPSPTPANDRGSPGKGRSAA
jgi:hypothetical protein